MDRQAEVCPSASGRKDRRAVAQVGGGGTSGRALLAFDFEWARMRREFKPKCEASASREQLESGQTMIGNYMRPLQGLLDSTLGNWRLGRCYRLATTCAIRRDWRP